MSNKGKIVVFIYLVMLCVMFGVKDAQAAYDVAGFNNTVTQAINARKTSVDVSKYNINSSDISQMYFDLNYSNPYLFVATFTQYGMIDGKVRTMYFQYKYTAAATNTYISRFNTEVNKIISGVKSNMTATQKALYVHDYMVANYSYDYNAYKRWKDGVNNAIPDDHYTAMGLLVNKTGVCQGYALAYKYIMNKLGFECHMVTSSSMAHAWNIIKIDGAYYHVDVSWDDPTYDSYGGSSHKYFLISDGAIQGTSYGRTRHFGYSTPYKCTSTKYDNYFWKDVTSTITYFNGNWYYINASGQICIYYFSNNASAVLNNIPDKRWNVIGNSNSYYNGIYSKLVVYNNALYFNTKNKIYYFNPSNRAYSLVKTANTSYGWVYGLGVRDGVFVYQIKKTPGSEGDIYAYASNGVYLKAANICKAGIVNSNGTVTTTTLPIVVAKPTPKPTPKPVKIAISKCSIVDKNVTYNGKARTGNVTVKYAGKTLRNGVDYKLSYKNNRNVGYAKVTVTGIGSYTGSKTVTFRVNPKKVSGLKANKISRKYVTLKWSKVTQATYYEVYQLKNGKYKKVATVKGTSYKKTGLKARTSYKFKVRACKNVSGKKFTGSYSSVRTVKTKK